MKDFYSKLKAVRCRDDIVRVFNENPEFVGYLISDEYLIQDDWKPLNVLSSKLTFIDRLKILSRDPRDNMEAYGWNLFFLAKMVLPVQSLSSWLLKKIEYFETLETLELSPKLVCRISAIKACVLQNYYQNNPFKFARQALGSCQMALQIDLKSEEFDLWVQVKICEASCRLWQPRAEHSKYIDRSIEICHELLTTVADKISPGKLYRINNILGAAYSRRPTGNQTENLEHAISYYRRAMEIAEQENEKTIIATIQNNLGLVYRRRIAGDLADNIEKSIEYLNQALLAHRAAEHQLKTAQTLTNLGVSFCERHFNSRIENLHRAIECYKESLNLMDPVAHEGFRSWTYHNLGVAYYFLAQAGEKRYFEKAIDCYFRALEFRKRENSPLEWLLTTRNLAMAYINRSQGDSSENCRKALSLLEGALEAIPRKTHRVEWARTNIIMGIVLSHQTHDDPSLFLRSAEGCFNDALEVLKPDILPEQARNAAIHLGQLLIRQKRYTCACAALKVAIDADTLRYQQLFVSQARSREISAGSNAYYLMAHARALLGESLEALGWLEQGKSRILKEKLRLDRARFQNLPEDLRLSYRQASQRLQALNIEHYIPSRGIKEIIEDTRETRATLSRLIQMAQKFDPDLLAPVVSITDRLEEVLTHRVIIQYNITENGTDIFVIRKIEDSIIVDSELNREFGTGDMIRFTRNWIKRQQKLMVDPSDEEHHRWGKYVERQMGLLSRQLIDPILDYLIPFSGSKLTLIPQMSLHLLPLHLLVCDIGSGRHRLMDLFTVSSLPSLAIDPVSVDVSNTNELTYTGVSNPTGDLKWSDREITEASAIFTSGNSVVLRGAEAEPGRVKSEIQHADIIHFACHARFNYDEPYKSYLALAHSQHTLAQSSGSRVIQHKIETQPLYLADIFSELQLPQHPLVVLSCCDSGLSSVLDTADECISFSTAFISSGARAVVSSLWQVDDRATCHLMTRFYSKIAHENMSAEQALREAQMELSRIPEFSNPFYWGAFVYCGW